VHPSDERPAGGKPPTPEEREVARRRDELLANSRQAVEGKAGDSSGSAMMGLGLQFVVAILVCLSAGMWLDRKLGTGPWLLLLGVLVGASAGFYSMYHILMEENRKAKDRRPPGDGPP